MSSLADNIGFMKEFRPLNREEFDAVFWVRDIFTALPGIPCTACKYCVGGCPKQIQIPNLFSCYNAWVQFHANSALYYGLYTANGSAPADCVKCGKCEQACPQHLPIRKYIEDVAKEFQ